MKIRKALLLGLFLLVGLVLAFIGWASAALGPAPEALAALRSDAKVTVSLDKFLVFEPASREPSTGFVFYPGGRVNFQSYAVPLHNIAAEGYLVIVVPVRLNLALFDSNAADRAISAFPSIRHWAVGGHSLGGVAAAVYASQHEDIEGLVLWASQPPDDSLENSAMKVISIYGSADASAQSFEEARALLPASTKFMVIQGGNHAQFGDYGIQPGDNEATISRLDQQSQIVGETVNFLKELDQ